MFNFIRKQIIKHITHIVERLIFDNTSSLKQRMLKIYSYHGDINKLTISDKAIVNNALFNLASGKIIIEDYVFFGHNVCILTGTHDYTKIGEERWKAVPREGNDIHI